LMFAHPRDLATAWWRQFLTEGSRWTIAVSDWFDEPGRAREARGLKLLKEWLSPEQLAQYEANGYFDVRGCDSGKKYRIRHGTGTNIYEIDDAGRTRAGWCFVPEESLVAGDVVLAQKIALETDERGALAVANHFVLR
jgi:hypothetical protein